MLYTKGVLKIFSPPWSSAPLDNIQLLAKGSGYKVLAFNGTIYVWSGKEWIETVFQLDDFSNTK